MKRDNIYHSGNISNYKFLITGGAGFIGSNLVAYLLKHNAGHVRVFDNLSNGHYENIKEFSAQNNFEFIKGDIRDLDFCKEVVKGIDYVSHQAALGSVPRSIDNPIVTNEVNISGFLNMLCAAKDEASVKKMVYAASSSTYGDSPALPKVENVIGAPLSPYAVTKLVNELYAEVFSKVYGFESIGLRYFNVFGPNQDPNGPYAAVVPLFIQAAIQGVSPKINGDGEVSRDFTFVENVIQANIKAMLLPPSKQHMVINVACGHQITLNHLWKLITEVMEVGNISPEYGPPRAGDIKHSLADISKARSILKYDPLYSVEEGLRSLKKQMITGNK